jgi:heparanase 1
MSRFVAWATALALSTSAVILGSHGADRPPAPAVVRLTLDGTHPAAQVDERFVSFAIDTAQVVGGSFWAAPGRGHGLLDTAPVPRFDFGRLQLVRLARALAPAYLRIGGTDADRTAYQIDDAPPASGARWVLTRHRWDELADFARAADLRLMFTLNAGPSARDRHGDWDPESARPLIEHARRRGDPVEVWELGNEVNAYPLAHGTWLSADRYARDLGRARSLIEDTGARLAGPASAFWPVLGEGRSFIGPLLERAGPLLDVVTWHYYPQQSRRCPVATRRARAGRLLPAEALGDVERWAAQVEGEARAHAPEAAVWLGETGGAQCGGEPGLSDTFADTLWWLDELGRIARRGQQVVVRQTLAGSDYGLLDDGTLEPNPSYWGSWLWRRLMDGRVLSAASEPTSATLRVYAHCAREAGPGAVTLLLLNLEPQAPVTVQLGSVTAAVLRLEAEGLAARRVRLDGVELRPAADGAPPPLVIEPRPISEIRLTAQSAAFVVLPAAHAPACL